MKARKLIIALAVAAFSLSHPGIGMTAGLGDEIKGTVINIERDSVTIKDFMGDEKTVEPKNPEALRDLKVGDRAQVKDGILTKLGGNVPGQ
ncbi:MAG TPA: hypothetical protein VE080_00455 [Candidatus Aquicultoraceae bacterium]|jgi:hypothetical protein|nr:hypothetical protein [Candidatus Aquicultoraceae bacterium]